MVEHDHRSLCNSIDDRDVDCLDRSSESKNSQLVTPRNVRTIYLHLPIQYPTDGERTIRARHLRSSAPPDLLNQKAFIRRRGFQVDSGSGRPLG